MVLHKTMTISDSILWQAIIGYAMIQGLVFFVLFLGRKSGDKLANRIIAALSLCCAITLSEEFVSLTIGYERAPHMIFAAGPLWYVYAPLIFMYVRYYTQGTALSYRDVLHAVPALFVLSTTLEFYGLPGYDKYNYLQGFIHEGVMARTHSDTYIIYLVQNMAYAFLALRLLQGRKKGRKLKHFNMRAVLFEFQGQE